MLVFSERIWRIQCQTSAVSPFSISNVINIGGDWVTWNWSRDTKISQSVKYKSALPNSTHHQNSAPTWNHNILPHQVNNAACRSRFSYIECYMSRALYNEQSTVVTVSITTSYCPMSATYALISPITRPSHKHRNRRVPSGFYLCFKTLVLTQGISCSNKSVQTLNTFNKFTTQCIILVMSARVYHLDTHLTT